MVAFLASILITASMAGVAVLVGKRRPPGKPLTWGEAFVAATFVFAALFLAYGVMPHHWLALAENEFKWRNDKIGIPLGGLKIGDTHLLGMDPPYLLFDKGIPLPNGYFIITAETVRDIIATLIYGVAIGVHFYLFAWWQKRGKVAAAAPELVTSAFGRPLVRRVE